MSDESSYTTHTEGTTPTGAGTGERVGFCQDCGTPLTRETMRAVGTGVFCEPCLTARVGTAGPGSAAGYASSSAAGGGYTTVPPVAGGSASGLPPMAGTPRPVLAALLSIIPGVGTMYNGQYAKGIAYLLIISVLDSLGKNDHLGIFGLFAAVAWIYQIIDAYQTAKAMQEGRPLPNPFGLNEIGERLGFGKNWGTSPSAAAAGTVPPAAATAASAAGYAPVNYPPATGMPVSGGADWVGYVPPTNFAPAYGVPPVMSPATAAPAGWGQAPYAATYTGTDGAYNAQVPVVSMTPAARRFPTGAIWLIGLGVLFLLIEFTEQWGWSINGNWVPTIVFAGLAAWTLTRKLRSGLTLVCILRWPLVLATLAVLFALQAMELVSLGRTWPVLFIVFGVMLILERTALANMQYGVPSPSPYAAGTSVVPGSAEADLERTRAGWATGSTHEPADSGNNDLTKSGGL